MDTLSKAKKLQAMRNNNKLQFLNNLFLYSLTALIFTLLFSYPFWFPHLCSCLNHFLFVSLPYFKSFLFKPMCLFIVVNAIIVFLVGESKLMSLCSPPASEIHQNYFERSQTICKASTHMEKKKEEKKETNFTEEDVNKIEEKEKEEEKVKDDNEEMDIEKEEEEEEEEEEEPGLPTEELNKRVEDFIARVNKQRWLEARLIDCERG